MTEVNGDRFNNGKLRLDLIFPEWVARIAHSYGSAEPMITKSIASSLTRIMKADKQGLDLEISHAIDSIVLHLKVYHGMNLDAIVRDITEVMVLGEEKYSAWNWSRGMMYGTMMGCANRHWYKSCVLNTEIDEESSRNHLSHCLINVLFMSFYQDSEHEGLNDLLGSCDA